MWKDKESKRYIIGFIIAFLIFAIIRNGTYFIEATHEKPYYFYMISQIGCTLLVGCWMLTVQIRIYDLKIRRMMLCSGFFFILYFIFQMVKYCIFTENYEVGRYMWYSYYIPMTIIPLLAFYILLYLSSDDDNGKDKWYRLLLIPAVLICVGFLTNDLHQQAFGIPNWDLTRDKERTLEPIYFIYIGFVAFLLILGIFRVVRMRKNMNNRKKLLLPSIPLLIGIVYIVIYSVKPGLLKINRHYVFELAEIFAFMMIGFLEVCIQIRLIPSNVGYEKLFSLTEIPAWVKDKSGKTVFETKGATNVCEDMDNHRLESVAVNGGNFVYDIDLSDLNRLNRELDEATNRLETRNELLQHENEINEEREKSDAAIRIYDSISLIVRPKILKVQELLSVNSDDVDFRDRLAKSAVLNAYIKRRSNMELEAQKEGILPFKELVTAVSESLEYIKLTGIETYISASGKGNCTPWIITKAYSAFEEIVEITLGNAKYITVRLIYEKDITMRFLINGEAGDGIFSEIKPDGWEFEYSVDENDVDLVVRIKEGGEEE